MTHLDSVLESRDITLPTKFCRVKVMVFLVVTYGCESWTVKKAECRRIDAFQLTARRSNQSILKEISPEHSLEGLMLQLKLQHFGHMTWRVDSMEGTLMLGKTEGRRRGGNRGLNGITNSMDISLSNGEGQGSLACCSPCCHKELDWVTEWWQHNRHQKYLQQNHKTKRSDC